MSEYADVISPPFGEGPNLMPGLSQVMYFASVNDFATISVPVSPPVSEKEKYTISTAHAFKPTKCFHKMYTSIEQGQLQFEALGGNDATGFRIIGTGFIPGDSEDLNYFANEAQGDRFIVIIKRADGKLIQVGTEDFPATIKAVHDSGNVSADASGYTVNISAYTPFKYLYDAAIQLTPEPEEV